MKCEHDTRTLELPGLGEPAKPASAPPVRAGRGPYRSPGKALYCNGWFKSRQALGLTMKELAELAGVGLRTIERIERGHKPSLGVEIQLHEALRRAEAKQ